MTRAYALFHLNLAYSSIDAEQHATLVARCYTPLLDLIEETGLPLGIELTGWTLERLAEVAPHWVERLADLLRAGRCELIGSGYAQVIGPLVPSEVNRWNLRLGQQHYRTYLGTAPAIALVNELAYSDGLVGLYCEAGFRGLVLDRDNALLARGALPARVRGPDGAELPVLWADSVLFQRLQRYAHGDITTEDYLAYFRRRATDAGPLPLYCNDAEVFDFRPGRFETEARLHPEGEWRRLARLFRHLADEGVHWVSPSEALAAVPAVPAHRLTTAAHPVPVKKQAKYNLSRWAVTGRNDLWINSRCHLLFRHLPTDATDDVRRRLLRLWASDLRTHITDARWSEARAEAQALARMLHIQDVPARPAAPAEILRLPSPGTHRRHGAWEFTLDSEGIYLHAAGPAYTLALNLRRGLALHSLAFAAHDWVPLIGSLPQGHFDSIELGADFYSMHCVLELPTEHRRITDLEWVHPQLLRRQGAITILGVIDTPRGAILKTYTLGDAAVSVEAAFPGWSRPHGSVRVGAVTLLRDGFAGELKLHCRNGGDEVEDFPIALPCLHTEPASTLVSCRTGFGATDGWLRIGDGKRNVELRWDPAHCAALPLLHHRPCAPDALTRVVFSLAELDETSRPEGDLPPFHLTLRPA